MLLTLDAMVVEANDGRSESGASRISAAVSLGAFLARMASASVVFWGIAYCLGWNEARGYYSYLGCPWFVRLIPAGDLVTTALLDVLLIAAVAFPVFGILAEGRATVRSITLWEFGVGVPALIASEALSLVGNHLNWSLERWLMLAVVVLFSVTTGILIGELIARHAESQQRWTSKHYGVIALIVIIGLFQGPQNLGSIRARKDGDLLHSTLPVVTLNDGSSGRWRLVTALQRQVLIMKFGGNAKKRAFRLVSPEAISRINASQR